MIEDPHERTRAILWCLADADPGMPLLSALGHLKAVEVELDRLQAEAEKAAGAMADPDPRSGAAVFVPDLVRDMSSHPAVVSAARSGAGRESVAAVVATATGLSARNKKVLLAAESLVNMYAPD